MMFEYFDAEILNLTRRCGFSSKRNSRVAHSKEGKGEVNRKFHWDNNGSKKTQLQTQYKSPEKVEDCQLITTNTDKGNSVVVLDRQNYVKKMQACLDSAFVPSSIRRLFSTNTMIKKFVKKSTTVYTSLIETPFRKPS